MNCYEYDKHISFFRLIFTQLCKLVVDIKSDETFDYELKFFSNFIH